MTYSGKAWATPKGPVPHGTLKGYSIYRCRCTACREASAAYRRGRRGAQTSKHGGRSTRIDVPKLQNALDADNRTDDEIAAAAGYSGVSAISHIKERGSGAFWGIDALACTLGMHISELMADPSELWREEVTKE